MHSGCALGPENTASIARALDAKRVRAPVAFEQSHGNASRLLGARDFCCLDDLLGHHVDVVHITDRVLERPQLLQEWGSPVQHLGDRFEKIPKPLASDPCCVRDGLILHRLDGAEPIPKCDGLAAHERPQYLAEGRRRHWIPEVDPNAVHRELLGQRGRGGREFVSNDRPKGQILVSLRVHHSLQQPLGA